MGDLSGWLLAERIVHWAKQTPYNTALIHNGRHVSYRSFARRIAKARGFFARRGFTGPGHAVLAVHNMMEFWILSLALRSLGLTTLAARSVTAVHNLGLPDLRLMVTSMAEAWPELEDVCAARGLSLLSAPPDGEASLPLDAPGAQHPPGGHIVWTSGTTGADKMVLLSAANDSFYLPLKLEAVGVNWDTVLCMFGISGATSAGCRWAASPWIAGGTTLIEQGSERYQALLRPGITHAFVNPAMLASILAAPAGSFPRSDAMRLFVGGGLMTQAQVDQSRARITPHVLNYFASTEVGVIAVTHLDSPDDRHWHQPVAGRLIELADKSGHPVPAGEPGLLRIDTAGGPTGYIDDEAATRAFFRDGFFYTGDLAVRRPDGRLALQGRITDVINVQGKKISPARFEERLADLSGANGVCLFSLPNDSGEEELHAVLEMPEPIDPDPMREVLRELKGFNQAIVHFIAAMPRNEMGKIVRREVRALVRTDPGQVVRW